MSWFIVVIALVGVFLNARGKWQGFLFWLVSNAFWFRHNIIIAEYAQAALFGIFWFLSLYGISQWQRKHKAVERQLFKAVRGTRQLSSKQMKKLLRQNVSMSSFIRTLPNKRLKTKVPKRKGKNHGKKSRN